ncbi:MAG: hypothetical protein K1X63_16635 [Chitinophagales bacterium]|nr:hypothetical protein [Chitinophagales bacterium]
MKPSLPIFSTFSFSGITFSYGKKDPIQLTVTGRITDTITGDPESNISYSIIEPAQGGIFPTSEKFLTNGCGQDFRLVSQNQVNRGSYDIATPFELHARISSPVHVVLAHLNQKVTMQVLIFRKEEQEIALITIYVNPCDD